MEVSLSPFLAAASTDPGAAVVDEDADHDEGEAEYHRQDGPEQGGVELRPGQLQKNPFGFRMLNLGLHPFSLGKSRNLGISLKLHSRLTVVGFVGSDAATGCSVWLLSLVGVCTTGPSTKMRPSSVDVSGRNFGSLPSEP